MGQNKWEKFRNQQQTEEGTVLEIPSQVDKMLNDLKDYIYNLGGKDTHIIFNDNGNKIELTPLSFQLIDEDKGSFRENAIFLYDPKAINLLRGKFLDGSGKPYKEDEEEKIYLDGFIKDVLLKRYKGDKEESVNDVKQIFNQGEILVCGSTSITEELQKLDYVPVSINRTITITPAEHGFQIKEFFHAPYLQKVNNGEEIITADEASDKILQGQCILDLDFSEDIQRITVKSASIAYGNEALCNEMRFFKNIILEWLIEKFNNVIVTVSEIYNKNYRAFTQFSDKYVSGEKEVLSNKESNQQELEDENNLSQEEDASPKLKS